MGPGKCGGVAGTVAAGGGAPRAWLLHARYVRGEHAACGALADRVLQATQHTHRYAFFVQGLVLADAGRLQEALEKFHSCIRLQPRDPEPLKHVAKCLSKQGRYQLALETYKEAHKLSPKPDLEIFCCLAECMVTLGNISRGEECTRKVVITSDVELLLAEMLVQLGSFLAAECAAQLGDIPRGVEWAREAVNVGGGERAAALLARLLMLMGDTDGALVAFDTALQSNACSAETLAAAGALRLRSGDPRRAFQLLGAALAQKPTYHPAALALAAMMLEHRDVDAALARLRTALAAHPDCVAAYSNLGLALLSKRKFVAAVTCLQRAASAAPLSAHAAHNLGLALLMGGRVASAFCRLAAAAALDPTNATTVMLIGVALERLRDERADAAYCRAATLAPACALVRCNLAARHARAARLPPAAEHAAAAAALLGARQPPDEQLQASLEALTSWLRRAGVEVPNQQQVTSQEPSPSSSPPVDIGPDEV